MNKKEAHPNALDFLKSDIYWNSSDATLPFYNEDASEVLESISDLNSNDVIYQGVLNYLETIGHGDFDYSTLDAIEIEEYNANQNEDEYFATDDEFIAFKEGLVEEFEYPDEQEALFHIEFGKGSADAASIHIDQTIIAVVFGSFIKNGLLSQELFQLGKLAIERELMEFSLLKFDSDSRFIREVELKILLADLDNLLCKGLYI
jgi:uncharacterized protein YfeS